MSPSVTMSTGGTVPSVMACQSTLCPFRTNAMDLRPKSQRMGPSDSNHWTPRTMS
jgi:hypothetical protein